MDHDNDGAINLSTSQRPSACTTPNGSTDFEDADQVGERKFPFLKQFVWLCNLLRGWDAPVA